LQDLIDRSLRLWHRCHRPEATQAELVEALSVIPALAAALGAASAREDEARSAGERGVSQALQRFGRHLAHEVRNRLNLVEFSLDRAAILAGKPEVREALQPVRSALHNLAAVANDLLLANAGKDGDGDGGDGAGRLSLRTVVQSLLDASRDLAGERRIALEVDGELPDVEVDGARVELVLVNLLTNALRHADPAKDPRFVRLECRRLGDGDEDGDGWRIAVRDNGVGIPAALRNRLFSEPEPGADGSPPKNGMGLAIVRQAVERSGGRVWLESDEGVGTTVYFTLPGGGEPGRC
jgi:signal transduction histidine kinase